MTILSNALEDSILTHFFVLSQHTVVAGLYVAYHSGDPGEDGTLLEEVVGNNADYVRQAVTFAKLANNSVDSQANVTWTPAAGSSFVASHISIWTAATAGICYAYGALDGSRTVTPTAPLTIAAGDLIIAID